MLKYLKLKPRDYFVSFTLNTTYGLNLLLSQFDVEKSGITSVTTTDLEHNSPFLSTLTFARRHEIPRHVIERHPDGSLDLAAIPPQTLLVMSSASNIDGRRPENLSDIIKKVQKSGGFVIIDAAQAMAHSADLLQKTSADAICFSAHKMYAPSLGGMVIRKDFAPLIRTEFIGGGMVDDVDRDTFLLSSDNPSELHAKFEPGLQAWGEIIALGAALDWLESLPRSAHSALADHASALHEFLSGHPKVHLVGSSKTLTMSFYVDGLDSHLLGAALAREGIMARTGYFCVHYYLDHVLNLPPLIRFSLGYHTRPSDIEKTISVLTNL